MTFSSQGWAYFFVVFVVALLLNLFYLDPLCWFVNIRKPQFYLYALPECKLNVWSVSCTQSKGHTHPLTLLHTVNPSPINPENFQCDAFRAGNPQGVEKILKTQLRVPMLWDARIQSIHESFNKLEIDFFGVRGTLVRIGTRDHFSKDDPWRGCDPEGSGWIRRNRAWESCRNARIALEYWMCMIRVFMRVWHNCTVGSPEGSQGVPCCTKVTR